MRNVALSRTDRFVNGLDRVLRTLWGNPQGTARANPAGHTHHDHTLGDDERRKSGRLMRVNFAGEVAAQALYHGQGLFARDASVARRMQRAADEENDHLIWCRSRLEALETRPSLLNPFWYLGAFSIGASAGIIGDAASLGFLEETEAQVVEHLERHLKRLPEKDVTSRQVLEQMRTDNARHGQHAHDPGARRPRPPVRTAITFSARAMTRTAYLI